MILRECDAFILFDGMILRESDVFMVFDVESCSVFYSRFGS